MSDKYYYKIYGLTVASEIRIQEAYPWEDTATPDVEITIGKMPEFLWELKSKGYGTWTNGFVNAWFQTPEAAQFYVEKGRSIIVEPIENANMDLVCSMILSAGLCLILLQRNIPVLHGSAIAVNGNAAIISGGSGSGKSTITMELLKHDVGFLADDTVRVEEKEGKVVAYPTYPQQKICRNLAEEYGLKLEKLRYIDEQRDKFALMRGERYIADSMPLAAMIILEKNSDVTEVKVRKLAGKELLDAVIDNLYLSDTYKYYTGVPMQLMQQIIGMASAVEVYVISRPAEGNTVEEIVTEIHKILQFC